MKKLFLTLACFFLFPLILQAHPGGTDSRGCHTCRTNCPSWGLSSSEYHCHNAKALPQPEYPIRSHFGEGGTGSTEPWPDYAARAQPEPSNPTLDLEKLGEALKNIQEDEMPTPQPEKEKPAPVKEETDKTEIQADDDYGPLLAFFGVLAVLLGGGWVWFMRKITKK